MASAAQYMYIGPNRLKEGLKTYQVFIGMPEDLLGGLKEKYPHIGRLFVAVGKLNETMAALGKNGTPVNLAYAEILEVK